MIAKTLLAQDQFAPVEVEIGPVWNPGTSWSRLSLRKYPPWHFLDFVVWMGFSERVNRDRSKEKKAAFNLSDSSKQHSREHWSPQSKAPMDKIGTAMRSGYALFRKTCRFYNTRITWCRIKRWKSQSAARCIIVQFLAILHRLILKWLWKRASSDAESCDFASVWPASKGAEVFSAKLTFWKQLATTFQYLGTAPSQQRDGFFIT